MHAVYHISISILQLMTQYIVHLGKILSVKVPFVLFSKADSLII